MSRTILIPILKYGQDKKNSQNAMYGHFHKDIASDYLYEQANYK
jgi:hypothetical protein